MRQKLLVIGLLAALVVASLVLASGATRQPQAARAGSPLASVLWPVPRPLQAFQLDGPGGQAFGPAQMTGHWSLVFFGYTSCPDICPTTLKVLQDLSQIERQRGREPPRVLFVSLDPQRDDPTRLAQYAGHFGENIVGLGGDLVQLEGLLRQAGAMFEYGMADARGNYDIAHTSSVFVVDPAGRLFAVLSPPHQAPAMAARLEEIRRHYGGG